MSLDSWKAEFYAVEADPWNGSTLEAIEHSLKKWRGLRRANMVRHNVFKEERIALIRDADTIQPLALGGNTCALCTLFYDASAIARRKSLDDLPECHLCPLVKSGRASCEQSLSPYMHWAKSGDPEKMIADLKHAHNHAAEEIIDEKERALAIEFEHELESETKGE